MKMNKKDRIPLVSEDIVNYKPSNKMVIKFYKFIKNIKAIINKEKNSLQRMKTQKK
jgi:hypothetical protein